MANTSLVIVVTSARTIANLGGFIKDASEPREEMRGLRHLFERLSGGLEKASVTVQSSASAPVRATGTLTLTFASIANNDTVTIAGTVLTCVTGTPSGAQFKKVTDGPTTAVNLAALINSNATLSLLMKAVAVSSVVTCTINTVGAIGNQATLATSNSGGIAVSAANFATGAGGAETSPVAYSRGL